MRAALCKAFGDPRNPETIVVEDIAEPKPGPNHVVLKVGAAALNFLDTLTVQNKYQFKPDMPFSPSTEVAGTIDKLGSGVQGFAEGDRVLAYLRFNGAREKAVAEASQLIPVPDDVSDEVASCISVTYGTAFHGLRDRAKLQKGETLFVSGASGGAGLAALQIGKLMGARVIAGASSPEKLAICKDNGADDLVNYTEEDLKESLKDLTNGNGVDVIYDCIGGDYAEPALRAMAWEGRFLVVGFAAGQIPRIPTNLLLLKGCNLVGVFWGVFRDRNPDRHRAGMEQILEWCRTGVLKPHIEAEFPLEDTGKALALIANRQAKGKVVIKP